MVRVRLGPSPTGDPHVGTAYIALFNYVFARQQGGKIVLRIEDTDRTRSRPEWEAMLIDALHWLGLQWDEGPDVGGAFGPYRQSERSDIYAQHAAKLVERGAAYPCFCTPERLAAVREAQRARKATTRYDGVCRLLSPEEVAAKKADGISHVIRLKVPEEGTTLVNDALRGEVSFDNAQVDDQVLLKADGMPTYHLANVVDDHLMQISHVMRAEEWITSTPKHVLLYRGFGWEEPRFIHMPLLRNKDKSKISKRKNPVSLNYYRDAGFLPEALLNYLGMMGWTMPDGREKFSVADMVEHFSLERISLGGPVFDVDKLTWLNGVYIREEGTPEQMIERLRAGILSDEALRKVAPLVHQRIDKLEDFVSYAAFFFTGDLSYDEEAEKLLVPKKRSPKEAAAGLEAVLEIIDAMPAVEAAPLEEQMRALCERLEWKAKELFMPVRIAVTGRKATPPLFETMETLGKERCRRRLRAAIRQLKSAS